MTKNSAIQFASQSAHVVRQKPHAAISEGTLNHEIHDFMDDIQSDEYDSDDEQPEMKNQNFEFSDGYAIMRLVRLVLVVEVIAIAVDNPSLKLTSVFQIACRGVLFYSLEFYSRPFIDFLYVIQYFYKGIVAFLIAQHVPAAPNQGNTEITTNRRQLNNNP